MRSTDPILPGDRLKVPILLPTGRDALLMEEIVRDLRFQAVICTRLEELLDRMDTDSGPFIVGDEALGNAASIQALADAVNDQPEWSDLPGIIVTSPSTRPHMLKTLIRRREIVFIQRPVHKSLFTHMVKSAAQIRLRQFQVRDLIVNLLQANEALRDRTAQLQKLTLEMTRVEDRERRRIAGILHDDLQQLLASARLQTEMLFDHLAGEAQQRARGVYDCLSQAMDAARNLSHDLNPVILGQDHLDQSLEHLAQRMSHNYNLDLQTRLAQMEGPVSKDIKRFVYRSAQELLFNCVKHARAKQASLELTTRSDHLTLIVTDDGIGFEPQRLKIFGGDEQGFGLFSIRERVAILGGSLEVFSRPAEGSRFVLTVPCSPALAEK